MEKDKTKTKANEKKDKKEVKKVETKDVKKTPKKEVKEVKKEEKVTAKPKKENKDIEVKFTINKEKIFKGLGIAAIVLAILGFAYWTSKSYGGTGFQFTEIDIDTYLEYLQDDEKRIVYIGRPNCPHCVALTPILKRAASKNNLTVYYLNTITYFDEDLQDYTEDGYKLINSTEIFSQGISTPSIFIIQNGEVIDYLQGEVPESSLVELFTNNGFIK